jgi:hypothetical protein
MRASCGKVDPVVRAPNDALLKKKSIGWIPKSGFHFLGPVL